MKAVVVCACLACFGLGFVVVPAAHAIQGAPQSKADCACSASGGGTSATCGQCDSGAITLKIGCTQCCETYGGTKTAACSQKDGPGVTGIIIITR